MRDQDQLHQALLELEPQPGRHRVKNCPLGGGKTPGLSWRRMPSGQVLLTCHDHGHTYDEIADALGVQDAPGRADGPRLDPRTFGRAGGRQRPPSEATEDAVAYQLDSTEGQLTKWRRGDGKGKAVWYEPADHPSSAGSRWYTPRQLEPDGPVFVTEGEKVADALATVGWPVVTFGGATVRPSQDAIRAAGLAGREIVLVADHDKPGRSWISLVALELELAGCSVELLAGVWADGEDAADYLAPGATAAELHTLELDLDGSLLDALGTEAWASVLAPELLASEGMKRASDYAILDPPTLLQGLVLDAPGIVTALYSQPGAGKSAVADYLISRITRAGDTVLVLDYEGTYEVDHLPRLRGLGADLELVYIGEPVSSWTEAAAKWPAMVKGTGARLVVVDSLLFSLAGGEDANDTEAPRAWRRVANQLPCPILAIGHTPKATSTLFGSQAWTALARLTWELRYDQAKGLRELVKAKGNTLPGELRHDVELVYEMPDEALLGQAVLRQVIITGAGQVPMTIGDAIVAVLRQARTEAEDDYLGMSRNAIREALAGVLDSVPAANTVTRHADELVEDGRLVRATGKRGARLYDLA